MKHIKLLSVCCNDMATNVQIFRLVPEVSKTLVTFLNLICHLILGGMSHLMYHNFHIFHF